MKKIFIPVLTILVLLSPSLNAQSLKINLPKGKKITATETTVVNTAAEVMGQSMETSMSSDFTSRYEITEASIDSFILLATNTKIKADASIMGQQMSYNSEDPNSSGSMADQFKDILNKPQNITIGKAGKITHQHTAAANNSSPISMLSNMAPSAESLFIPAMIGKEMKAGNSFTDVQLSTGDAETRKDSGTYVINSIQNGVAMVSYTGTQQTKSVMEQMGMEMTATGDNKVMKEIQIDINTGLVILNKTTIEMHIIVDAAGMTIPSTGKTVTTVEVKQG